jgi:immunoglobulin-binding protein 1
MVQDLYVSLIRRSINETRNTLDSIEWELELIKHGKKMEEEKQRNSGRLNRNDLSHPGSHLRPSEGASPLLRQQPRDTIKPFIITRNEAQKQIYGLGYPSLPVMTVEELYQQRRENGEWGPPPQAGAVKNTEFTQEETEAMAKEFMEENDDEANIGRQRQNDEYKDDHRRGWGNRFNRS